MRIICDVGVFTEMPKFEITKLATKIFAGLGGGKTTGLDELSNLILEDATNEISPFLKIIFYQSLLTGRG